MFKDDSINLTYKRLQLLETNDKSVKEGEKGVGGGRVKWKRFKKEVKQRKCRIRLPLGDVI